MPLGGNDIIWGTISDEQFSADNRVGPERIFERYQLVSIGGDDIDWWTISDEQCKKKKRDEKQVFLSWRSVLLNRGMLVFVTFWDGTR